MPQWAYERWADLDPENRRGNNQFMPWDVRSPHLREVLTNFLDAVLPTVRGKPALLDYDLVNEAWYRPFSNLDPATVADFRQRHPSVKSEAVPEDYTTEQISQFLQWFAGEVRQRDARHPIYVKVLTSQEILCVDREAVGDLLTANGMDSYPAYPDPTGVLAADFAWTLLRLDFHRSLTPDKPILDGEYHPCASAYEMPEAYFRAALWLAALHGKDSTALWVDGRVDDVSIDWHANGVEVLGHSALDFLRLGKEIQAFQKQRADIAVYYGAYHENYRTREEWDAGIREAYLASLFQDVDIGILTEKRVHAGALSRYKVVVVPAGCTPTAEESQKFANFQRRGGIVVQCPSHTKAQDLWPIIHQVVGDSHTEKLVAADHWGVECRSVMLGHRRLFYLANHNRESVDIQLNSAWSLADTIELRTQTHWQGSQMHMEPLEFRIVQALLNP